MRRRRELPENTCGEPSVVGVKPTELTEQGGELQQVAIRRAEPSRRRAQHRRQVRLLISVGCRRHRGEQPTAEVIERTRTFKGQRSLVRHQREQLEVRSGLRPVLRPVQHLKDAQEPLRGGHRGSQDAARGVAAV